MKRRTLFGIGLTLPLLGVSSAKALDGVSNAPGVDFDRVWLHAALLHFVKHYECVTRRPEDVYYPCRYHIDELPKIRTAALREFLLEPEQNIVAGKGIQKTPVVFEGVVFHPTRCTHLEWIISIYEGLVQTGRITLHRKLPNVWPYDNLEHIRIADSILPVVTDLLREQAV